MKIDITHLKRIFIFIFSPSLCLLCETVIDFFLNRKENELCIPQASKIMHIELNLEEDILTLYTPHKWLGKPIQHTRSALLQKRSGKGEDTLFTIVCSVTFNLVVSISSALPISSFLRFLILAYTKSAYDTRSIDSDVKKHATLSQNLSKETREYLAMIDQKNRENHEYCMKTRIFHDTPQGDDAGNATQWQWLKAGNEGISDLSYRNDMRNINFIRDVQEIDIHNDDPSFKDEVQYKIVLDNHLILMHLLNKLRYGHITLFQANDVKLKYAVRLLDPICTTRSRYELFKGTNYLSYVEKQLNVKENPAFSQNLHFDKSYPCRGGLLHPSLSITIAPVVVVATTVDTIADTEVTIPSKEVKKKEVTTLCQHTITAMLDQSTTLTAVESTWNQGSMENYDGKWIELKQEKSVSLKKKNETVVKMRHNALFIDLSKNEHVHVEYFERLKSISYRDPSAIKKPKIVKPDLEASTCTKKLGKSVNKNQPLLRTCVQNISEESKRKYEPPPPIQAIVEESEERPLKIPRIGKQQATLQHFFTK